MTSMHMQSRGLGKMVAGILTLGAVLSLMLCLSGPVMAKEADSAHKQPTQYRVTNLLGQTVVNEQGQEVGQITEIVLTPQGEEVEIILSVGGFLGLGDKNISLSLEELHQKQGMMVCDLCKADIQERPAYQLPAPQYETP